MEKTEKQYKQLNVEERAVIMLMGEEGNGLGKIGRFLKRSPSTISRELARNLDTECGYIASRAGARANRLRLKPRKKLKLVMGNELFEIVKGYLKRIGHLNKLQAHCSACTRTIQSTESAMRRFTTRCMPCREVS